MTDPGLTAALEALRQAARRSAVARRLDADAEQALLQTIVEATVTLFEAEASSIALFERDPDRLEFRVAAGAQGAGAIGLSIPPSKGIVGFVFSTGQPLALSDVLSDPRFDRTTAERTGYVPRSIAAVPLVDQDTTVGVLQVLDKHTSPTFSLKDMETASAINSFPFKPTGFETTNPSMINLSADNSSFCFFFVSDSNSSSDIFLSLSRRSSLSWRNSKSEISAPNPKTAFFATRVISGGIACMAFCKFNMILSASGSFPCLIFPSCDSTAEAKIDIAPPSFFLSTTNTLILSE